MKTYKNIEKEFLKSCGGKTDGWCVNFFRANLKEAMLEIVNTPFVGLEEYKGRPVSAVRKLRDFQRQRINNFFENGK